MKFSTAQKCFSILFVMAVFAASAANIYTQRSALMTAVHGLKPPVSERDAKDEVLKLNIAVTSHIFGMYRLVDLHSYIQMVLGKNEVGFFDYLHSEDGFLNNGNLFPIATAHLPELAERTRKLSAALAAGGTPFLYLSPPDVVERRGTRYADGLPAQSFNHSADVFLDSLRERGVDYLDLRDVLRESSVPPDKVIFKTDHHWTAESAFVAFTALVDEMERRYGAKLDPDHFYRNPANYHHRLFPRSFGGTFSRGAGIPFGGLDDITLIWPKFSGEYLVEKIDPLLGFLSWEGSPEESLFYMPAFQAADIYDMYLYNFYLGGVTPWAKITNRNNPDGPTLLLVHDSYGLPLATFLAPMFSTIYMVWPMATDFRTDIEKLIQERRFDYVVMELIPGNLVETPFDFFTDTHARQN